MLAQQNANVAGGTTTSVVLASSTVGGDGAYTGRLICFTSGSGAQQTTFITGYTQSTKTATILAVPVAPALGTGYSIDCTVTGTLTGGGIVGTMMTTTRSR